MQLARRGATTSWSHSARAPRDVVAHVRAKAVLDVSATKRELLDLASRTARGVSSSPGDLRAIQDAISELRRAGEGQDTTGPSQSGTWQLAWTTEKETLFILERAPLFGTKAGDVFQVIDTGSGGSGAYLQNVITFPPEGSFIVDSSLAVAGPQRVEFNFTAAKLKLPAGREFGLPPFGKGWFDNLYLDDDLRVSYDSRGDTLVTVRVGPPRRFT